MAESIVLGVLQGLTEFLPISSSGHLVLMKNLFGVTEPDLFFDVMVHVGTLIPILLVFKEDLLKLFRTCFTLIRRGLSRNQFKEALIDDMQVRLIILIGIATVPTGVIGLLFKDLFEQLFASLFAVGVSLMLTGTLLILTKITTPGKRQIRDMTVLDAALIGFSQALAITPGISRSGTTISIALFLGIERELAGRFSFLICIPAILGAVSVNFKLPESYALSYFLTTLVAAAAAAITGYFALRILLRFVRLGKLYAFSPYCYGVGLFTLLFLTSR